MAGPTGIALVEKKSKEMTGARMMEHKGNATEQAGVASMMAGTRQLSRNEEKLLKYIEDHPKEVKLYDGMLTYFQHEMDDGQAWYHQENRKFRDFIVRVVRSCDAAERDKVAVLQRAYRRSLYMDAKVDFDAYCLYIEGNRKPANQFYLPRRRVLGKVAQDLQKLETGELDLLTISLPPGTGKSTLALFFITWLGGKHPEKAVLTFSHDAGIVRGFYDEILRIISPDGEYLYRDVFPVTEAPLVSTNAKELRIDLGKNKRFETFQFSSVGAGNAGKYRASELLYCDDLCSGIEEAMSKDRMDKLWRTYSTDIRQRTSGDPPELHIATRWSVWDVIGRIERNEMDHPTGRAKFITIPALDENGESNFDYPLTSDRFTTARYQNLRDTMDDVDWRAIYMNQPIEREGQLYHPDELRRFFELPDTEPDGIVAVCDTKAKGSDYAFMPIMYLYGNDCYIADCVCDNGDPGIVEERLARILVKHKVQMCQFESNSAGWHIAEKVQNRVKELGGIVKITTKPTTANKETKIVVNAPEVKRRCLFLDHSKYKPNTDYGKAMSMLTSYTLIGRNKHDDVCDGMAMAVLYLNSMATAKVEIIQRPW